MAEHAWRARSITKCRAHGNHSSALRAADTRPWMPSETRPLFEIWPELESQLGFLALGDFPTPVEPLARLIGSSAPLSADAYVKRDDLSSPLYGGNKVRTL